jgi:hypothetical protein
VFWQILLSLFLPSASFAPSVGATYSDENAWAPVVDSITVEAYSPQQTPFAVRFGDDESAYRVMAMFVLPNEAVPVAVVNPAEDFALEATAGETWKTGIAAWTWVAPARPGVYPIEIREHGSDRSMTLNVFVMVPYAAMRRGSINGYRIGNYPRPRSEFYARPEGFVQVTSDMMDTQVSPHFRLAQFLCKQGGGPPEYLVLRQPLLVKLEQLLAQVNERGREAHTFSLMSAYRTPSYNAAIGNVTTYSRHSYGDAADIFVDDDGDGQMDDLNGDGKHSLADARWLGAIVNETQGTPEFTGLTGGLGTYEPTHSHGAFVHVDVRGFQARWGV